MVSCSSTAHLHGGMAFMRPLPPPAARGRPALRSAPRSAAKCGAIMPGRRQLVASSLLLLPSIVGPASAAESSDRHVWLEFSICDTALRSDRAIGDKSALCSDAKPIGRVTFTLFRDTAPGTCRLFEQLISDGVYVGTTLDKILPGQFVHAGKQGSKRYGAVDASTLKETLSNPDMVSSKAYERRHLRPGTLSWCLPEANDDAGVPGSAASESTEFIITTGPAPAGSLDDVNIVFGQVTSGMDVIREIAAVPTIRPSETIEKYNAIAKLIGDDRAAKAKSRWGKPLKAVVIADAGFA